MEWTELPEPREDGYTFAEALWWYSPDELKVIWNGTESFRAMTATAWADFGTFREWWAVFRDLFRLRREARRELGAFAAMKQLLVTRLRAREFLSFGYPAGTSGEESRALIPPDVWGGKINWREGTVEGAGRTFRMVRVLKPTSVASDEEAVAVALAAINGLRGKGRPTHRSKFVRAFEALAAVADLSAMSQTEIGVAVREFIWAKYPDMAGDAAGMRNRTIYNDLQEWLDEQRVVDKNPVNKESA